MEISRIAASLLGMVRPDFAATSTKFAIAVDSFCGEAIGLTCARLGNARVRPPSRRHAKRFNDLRER